MKKASEILSQFFDQAQLEKAQKYSSFFRSWRTIVGIDIASHTRVREIERDVLIVEADHPGWAQMIELKKRRILRDINKKYPEFSLSNIRVWIVQQLGAVYPVEREEGNRNEWHYEPPVFGEKEKNERKSAGDDGRLQQMLDSIGKMVKGSERDNRH
ncbi:DUF721 domain-containing protein [Sediminispirochaeta smaragdinae]|uniref:DUF721 domain-containing protein n=1 Tax=Sediminispirochaeta smaragdinae (strain DSM 11293 / JCM 15392 / SEBR 4228) TaxID=573413 RepID=E1R6N3_SEDSS|nr:DUF721 domain-containing protein [Sediminispirochaeta smaragdinae]ADK79165.1 protein of unknown function DUF721 [Sediminispirochaeta smaragdinae DSM 11293]